MSSSHYFIQKQTKRFSKTIFGLVLFLPFSIFIQIPIFAQHAGTTGNALTAGTFQDFSSPQGVIALPAIPVGDTPLLGEDPAAAPAVPEPPAGTDPEEPLSSASSGEAAADPLPAEAGSTEAELDAAAQEARDKLNAALQSRQAQPNQDQSNSVTRNLFPKDYFGMTLIGVNLFAETGSLDEIEDKYNDVKKNLASDAQIKFSDLNSTLASVDALMTQLDENGYAILDAKINLLTPIIFTTDTLSAAWTVELDYIGGGETRFTKVGSTTVDSRFPECLAYLEGSGSDADCANAIVAFSQSDTIDCDTTQSDTAAIIRDCGVYRINSDSYAQLKYYVGPRINLGFSTYLSKLNSSSEWLRGDFFVGAKYRLSLLDISDLQYTYKDYTESNDIVSTLKDNAESVQIHDMDISGLFVSKYYQVGIGLDHILSPALNYQTEKVTQKLKPYVTAALYNFFDWGRGFAVNYYEDLDKEISLSGIDYKWRVLSLNLNSDKWYIPSLRLGKRYNLTRTELEYNEIGVTLLNTLNINAAFTDEKVTTSIGSTPRSFFLNLSFDINV